MKSSSSTLVTADNGPVVSPLLGGLLSLLKIPRAGIAAGLTRVAREHLGNSKNFCDSSLELMRGLDVVEHELPSLELQRLFGDQSFMFHPFELAIDSVSA